MLTRLIAAARLWHPHRDRAWSPDEGDTYSCQRCGRTWDAEYFGDDLSGGIVWTLRPGFRLAA